jgi:hypothetical protein
MKGKVAGFKDIATKSVSGTKISAACFIIYKFIYWYLTR